MRQLLLIALLLPTHVLFADALSQLPEHWQNQLTEVAEPELSALEKIAHEAVTSTRTELNQLLSKPGASKAALAEAYGRMGALYQVYNVSIPAETCYTNARFLAPNVFRWAYYAAWLAQQTGRPRVALQHFKEAQKLQPDYAPLALRIAQSQLDLGQLEEARLSLKTALTSPELRAAALGYSGQIDLLEREYGKAIKQFKAALALDPKANKLHFFLAQAERANGNMERARKHLKQQGPHLPVAKDALVDELKALKQGARPHYLRAMRALRKGDYSASATAFTEGLAIDGRNVNARISLARVLWLSGEKTRAEALFEQIAHENPNQPSANYFHAQILRAKGRSALANKHFLKALEVDKKHLGSLLEIAHILFINKDFVGAAEQYATLSNLSNDLPLANLLQLVALKQTGLDDRQIKQQLEAALQQQPDYPQLQYALARLLAGSKTHGDTHKARSIINQPGAGLPMPEYNEVMALCAASEGQFELAVEHQQQAIAGALWMGRSVQRMSEDLNAYENKKPADEFWPTDDPSLSPPLPDPGLSIKNYPVSVPY